MSSDRPFPTRSLRRALWLVMILPSLWTLGRWSEPRFGVDAVSAVTPGHVSVVGARVLPAVLDATAADSLVRRTFYFSGGVHKAFESDARWILIRPSSEVGPAARGRYLQILESALLAIQRAADEADLALLVGGLDGGDAGWHEEIAARLQSPRLAALGMEILLVAEEETEAIDVPDSGLAAQLYDLPISLLECDAVINIAHVTQALGSMSNLTGLARPTTVTTSDDRVLVDLALLTEASYTLAQIVRPDGTQMLLASRDGVAVDRVAAELSGADTDSTALAALHLAHSRYLGQVDLHDIKVSGAVVPGTWVEPETTEAE